MENKLLKIVLPLLMVLSFIVSFGLYYLGEVDRTIPFLDIDILAFLINLSIGISASMLVAYGVAWIAFRGYFKKKALNNAFIHVSIFTRHYRKVLYFDGIHKNEIEKVGYEFNKLQELIEDLAEKTFDVPPVMTEEIKKMMADFETVYIAIADISEMYYQCQAGLIPEEEFISKITEFYRSVKAKEIPNSNSFEDHLKTIKKVLKIKVSLSEDLKEEKNSN